MVTELKENRRHGTKRYPFDQYYMTDIHHAFQFPVHWHDEVEIIYVERGKLHVCVGQLDEYGEEGDVFFVNPRELHFMSSPDGEVDYYTLLFPIEFISFQTMDDLELDLLAPIRSNRLILPPKLQRVDLASEIRPLIREIIRINQNLHDMEEGEIKLSRQHMQTRILLIQILQHLYDAEAFEKSKINRNSEMQKKMLEYIQERFAEKITLSMLAEEFHLSEKYVSRYFVEHFHLSFSSYVGHLRVTHAKMLLDTTDLTVTEIALRCGYTNISYFIRSFKKAYYISPLQYRKRSQIL